MKSGILALFGLTSFLAATLLFSVQPMIGKMVLPVLGGTPAVWTTCLLYFQVMLLGGYLFAHGVSHTDGTELRRVSVVFLCILATLLVLGYWLQPIMIRAGASGIFLDRDPIVGLLKVLTVAAALPLLMVSASAPLLQCWFALTPHPRARDPFFLYAASNAGSLLALLSYPLLIEPNLGLTVQSQLWRTGFLVLAILLLICGVTARLRSRLLSDQVASRRLESEAIPASVILRWIVLVFIPSSWLMGVTTYLTTDLAAIPLLWIIPLAIYLLSFIIAFAKAGAPAIRMLTRLLPYTVAPLVLVMSAGFAHAVWIPLHLLAFFTGCAACHGALAEARPTAARASTFYLTIACGGLLGGIFTALIAPLVFNRVLEYPLAIILACLIVPGIKVHVQRATLREWLGDLLIPGVVFLLTVIMATNQVGLADSLLGVLGVMIASGLGILACVTARQRPMRFSLTVTAVLVASGLSSGINGRLIHVERSFFGVVRVTHDSEHDVHRLFHGTTLHGQQSLVPALAREPSTYFTRSGPIGWLFEGLEPRWDEGGSRVAILGLGAGTLASYARPDQRWTFYEIDPIVARIARDPRFFTYLRDCRAETLDIVIGDARLRLLEAPDHVFALIVLDAFSSDSLPVHLLSREAIRLYRRKLAEGGVLAFNLSNRYLDLDPVIGRQAADAGMACRIAYDIAITPEEKQAGKQPSIWAVVAETEDDLGELAFDSRCRAPAQRPGSAAWTDDYSDLASYIRWLPWQTRAVSQAPSARQN